MEEEQKQEYLRKEKIAEQRKEQFEIIRLEENEVRKKAGIEKQKDILKSKEIASKIEEERKQELLRQ